MRSYERTIYGKLKSAIQETRKTEESAKRRNVALWNVCECNEKMTVKVSKG